MLAGLFVLMPTYVPELLEVTVLRGVAAVRDKHDVLVAHASVVLVGPRSSQDRTSVGYVDFLRQYQGGVCLALRIKYTGVSARFVPVDGERKDVLRVGDDVFTLEAAAGGSIDFNVKYAFKR